MGVDVSTEGNAHESLLAALRAELAEERGARREAERRAEALAAELSRGTEGELRRSQARYEALARTATQFVWGTGPTGLVEDMPEWRAFTGQSLEAVRGTGWTDAVHPEDRERAAAAWAHAVATRTLYEIEYRTRHHAGGYRWLHVRGVPVLEADGGIREWIGVANDVTEQRQSQAALEASEARYQLAAKATNDAIWDWDLLTNAVTWNPGVSTVFGYAAHQVEPTAAWWYEQIHPEDRERVVGGIHEAQDRGEAVWTDTYRFRRVDGSYAWVTDRGYCVFDEAGKPVRMVGAMHDRTRQREAEAALTEANRRLSEQAAALLAAQDALREHAARVEAEVAQRTRELQESEARRERFWSLSLDLMDVVDAAGILREVNPAWTTVLGWSREELIDRPFMELVHPDDVQSTLAEMGTLSAGGKSLHFENRFRSKDGDYRHIEWTAQPEGELFYAYGRDVTARKAATDRLRAQAAELIRQRNFAESIVENVPAGVAYLDKDWIYRVVNTQYAEGFMKAPRERFVDRFIFDALPGGEPQVEHLIRGVFETGRPHYETEFPFRFMHEGREVTSYWDFVYYPSFGADGHTVEGFFILANEVSARVERDRERERLQRDRIEALEQADRLKDEFLSILSHELRTPINAIMGFGSVLADEVAGPLSLVQRRYAEQILTSADALLALIDDLLVVSRVQAGKFSVRLEPVAFSGLAAAALDALAPEAARKGVEVVNAVSPGLPDVPADPQRLTQVINNLVGNAIKFTPQGGRVTLSARVEGERLRVEVADTGPGIALDDQAKLFKRFGQLDTSNTRSHTGTGLGLSIVKAIVEAHGGRLGVDSRPGEGATFWFELPA
jgi:PAS domain S-box-containing protein